MPRRLKETGTYSLAAVILLAVFLFSGCDSNQAPNQAQTQKPKDASLEVPAQASEQANATPTESQSDAGQSGRELYKIVKVVDGDTIDVDISGQTERLRLIGIDTPEIVDPRKVVQCFGKEASNKAKEVLEGKKISLEADSTQGERDKYQRLLRYVYLEDGTSFNKMMITEGFAHEYTYQSNPYKYQLEFKESEKNARENKKGLWGDLCNGNTTQSAENKTEDAPVIKLPAPTPKPTSSGSSYSCNCSKTCTQMGCAEAQYQLNTCGCSRRDADKDGVACDSQCQ